MTDDYSPRTDVFVSQQSVYGAYDSETRKLVLVVEAGSEIEGLKCVEAVAPWLGYKGVGKFVIVELEDFPPGVPKFLKAFFAKGKIEFNRENVAPSSGILQ